MEKIITISTLLFTCFTYFAQQQIGNSDMEAWDNIGQATEEPSNWNSFKSAQGSFTSFGSQQVQRSTSVRSGATGQYCARVFSKSTLGVVANGNLTVGRINMGSTTPSDPGNYNISLTTDPLFSEAITSSPDSLVFWVKFTPASGTPNARVHAVLHDSYDLRDPIDANSTSHVISRAELNYPSTGGQWVRKSVPFVNQGPATNAQFLLITFTTNQTPGGGAANDEVLVDDIELIYNSSNTNQQMTASNDTDATPQNTPVTINVVANDSDPENNIDLASLSITTQATNGTAVANNDGTITYTPATGFAGTDSFVYQVCDGGIPATCASGTVSILVNSVGSFNELDLYQIKASYSNYNGLFISGTTDKLEVINTQGNVICKGISSEINGTTLNSGIYFIRSEKSVTKLLVP